MTTQETQQQIIKEFRGLNDCMDKYAYLIKLGKTLPPIAAECKTDNTLIKGCQVKTWFNSTIKDGEVFYDVDSMSSIVKGVVVLLLRILNGQKPEDIKNADLYFIDKIGLREIFSPSRANSLWKLSNRMKSDAISYETK